MSTRTARKLGFWTACALLFGSVVGIGIFVKNGGVLRATENNGIAALLAWIVGGLISLFAAISFSEIGSQRTTNVHGLAGWAETGVGKRFGYLTRYNFAVFYQAILVVVISFFASEIFFQIIRTQTSPSGDFAGISLFAPDTIWVHVVVALVITTFFVGLNLVSVYASGLFSTAATILKVVPLVVAAVVGIVLVNTNNAGGFNNIIPNQARPFKFTGLLAALPAVLFAYDAFLNVGALSPKTKGGAKTVSKATLITLVAVVILYSLISVAQNLHNAGWIQNVFQNVFPSSSSRAISIFMWVFILISALGVTNGITASLVANFQQSVETNTIFGAKTLRRKIGLKNTTSLLLFSYLAFWALVIFVPTIVIGADNYVDSISNLPTLFFFVIYGVTIIGYWVNRKRIKADRINKYLFYVGSTLAIVGLLFASFYQLFYGYTIRAFINPDAASSSGFFISRAKFTIIEDFGIFLAGLILFFALPLLNAVLSKRFEGNNVVKDTQSLVLEGDLSEAEEFPDHAKALAKAAKANTRTLETASSEPKLTKRRTFGRRS